jgi:hypothetical protein
VAKDTIAELHPERVGYAIEAGSVFCEFSNGYSLPIDASDEASYFTDEQVLTANNTH